MNSNLERMKNCPRFHTCSVPKCPLDSKIDLRVELPEDTVCTLAKSIRMRLGKDLPMKGMTKREYASWKNWKNRSQENRDETIQKLRVKGKNYRFVPRGEK